MRRRAHATGLSLIAVGVLLDGCEDRLAGRVRTTLEGLDYSEGNDHKEMVRKRTVSLVETWGQRPDRTPTIADARFFDHRGTRWITINLISESLRADTVRIYLDETHYRDLPIAERDLLRP